MIGRIGCRSTSAAALISPYHAPSHVQAATAATTHLHGRAFSTSAATQQQGPRPFGNLFARPPLPPPGQAAARPAPPLPGAPAQPRPAGPVGAPSTVFSAFRAAPAVARPLQPSPGAPPRPAPGNSMAPQPRPGVAPPRPAAASFPMPQPRGPPMPGANSTPRPAMGLQPQQQPQQQQQPPRPAAAPAPPAASSGGVSVANIFSGNSSSSGPAAVPGPSAAAQPPRPSAGMMPRPPGFLFNAAAPGTGAQKLAPLAAPTPSPSGGSLAAFAQMRNNFQRLRLQRETRLKQEAAAKAAKRAEAQAAAGGPGNVNLLGATLRPARPGAAGGRLPGQGTMGRAAGSSLIGQSSGGAGGGVGIGMFGKLTSAKKASLIKARRIGAGGAGGGKGLFQTKRVVIRDEQTVRDLAEAAGVKVSRLLAKLSELGETQIHKATDVIDPDVAEILVQELGHMPKRVDSKKKDRAPIAIPDAEEAAQLGLPHRAPIVTVMGHVDHGKTTLLDSLRGSSVAEREAGGITQGVAAFSVAMKAEAKGVGERRAPGGKAPKSKGGKEKDDGKKGSAAAIEEAAEDAEDVEGGGSGEARKASSIAAHVDVITFLDTPGHALFGSMRQRGAALTDIVVLVVDGKDGVMPQTKECVETIVKANIPTIVAVTKCDLVDKDAACDMVGKQLLELGLATEAFGGEAPCVPVSAKSGFGLQDLKDAIAVQAEMLDLRAAQDDSALGEATVIDARLLKGTGLVVDAVVRWGKLNVGDVVVCGEEYGKIKAVQTDAVGAASVNKRIAAAAAAASAEEDADASAASISSNGGKKSSKKDRKNGKKASDDILDDPEAAAAMASAGLVTVESALPGTPVRILGLKGIPVAGEMVLVVSDRKEETMNATGTTTSVVGAEEVAKEIVESRRRRREAQELFRVAAADAVKRAAERSEYNKVRERRLALKAAQQRESQRKRLRKAGAPIPPDLELQPWEVLILKEFADGKISAGSTGGKQDKPSQRTQGGQQTDVGFSFASAAALADKRADGAATGDGADAAAAAAAIDPSAGPKPVAFITKSDSAASLVALQDAVSRISAYTDEVLPRVVQSSVGEVSEKDVQMAADMQAHILAFNAKVPQQVAKLAERKKITIINGRVIYHVLDAACDLLSTMLKPDYEEETVAVAEVKQVFTLNQNRKSDAEMVAGCVITEGTFLKSGLNGYRVLRGADNAVVGEASSLLNLMHFKDKVESVKKGSECGISFPTGSAVEFVAGDRIVAWKTKTIPKKLKVMFD